jgi:peptidoglycan/LPS O-acetylase OafA/YrhL
MSDQAQSPGGISVEARISTGESARAPHYQTGFRYVPALDGLRGLAILVVMIYHAVPEALPGAFLGVELFFVLSGFLITSLLLKEHDHTGIQLGRFYMRRVLRLAPAMIVMLASVVLLSRLAFSFDIFRQTTSDAAFSLGYIFNWVRATDPGRTSFLGHTWSLCIEEQFYALWPLALPTLLTVGRRDRLTKRILLAVAAVFLWRLTLSFIASPMRLYNGLDTRADGLLLGCALGAAIHDGWIRFETGSTKQRLSTAMPFCVAALVTLCYVARWYSFSTYLVWLPLTGVLSATLICGIMANASSSRHRLMAILQSRPALKLGKLSYSLYLWHYPIYRMMAAAGASRFEVAFFGTAATFALAVASWHLVEKPMLRLKDRFATNANTPEAAHGVASPSIA